MCSLIARFVSPWDCRHLQGLLRAAYCDIYSAEREDVEFILVPMPRLEIETIQDFKILHEIGALTPDMTVKLSRILLGEEPGAKRRRAAPAQASDPFPERQSGKPAEGQKEGPPDEKKGEGKKTAPKP